MNETRPEKGDRSRIERQYRAELRRRFCILAALAKAAGIGVNSSGEEPLARAVSAHGSLGGL
jgi:hypothetical protein